MNRHFVSGVIALLSALSLPAHAQSYEYRLFSKGLRVSVDKRPPLFEFSDLSSSAVLSSISLGSTQVNKPTSKTVSMKNVGTAPVIFGAAGITAPAPFSVVNTTCEATLPVGESCEVNLNFNPTTEGDSSAPLSVSYAAGTVTPITIAGSGAHPLSVVSVTGPSSVAVGSTVRYDVTVKNTSSTEARLNHLRAPNPGQHRFEPSSAADAVPANGGQDTFSVYVTPGKAGDFEPVLEVYGTYEGQMQALAKVPLKFTATSTFAYSSMEPFQEQFGSEFVRNNYSVTSGLNYTLSNPSGATTIRSTTVKVPVDAVSPKLTLRGNGRDGATLQVQEVGGSYVLDYSYGAYTSAVKVFAVNLQPGKNYVVTPRDSGSYGSDISSILLQWN